MGIVEPRGKLTAESEVNGSVHMPLHVINHHLQGLSDDIILHELVVLRTPHAAVLVVRGCGQFCHICEPVYVIVPQDGLLGAEVPPSAQQVVGVGYVRGL
jgi:endonuclease/exonuclease/phosphatase family metal-dependent hydrolase